MAPPKQAGGAVGSFPPMTPDSVQRYQAMFAQLDGDHDGWVQVRCPLDAPLPSQLRLLVAHIVHCIRPRTAGEEECT